MGFGRFTRPDQKLPPTIAKRVEGTYEPETLTVLKALIRPGYRVLEVGARWGYFTMILSHLVGETGRVDSFEGERESADILLQNVAMNDCSNVSVHAEILTADPTVDEKMNAVRDRRKNVTGNKDAIAVWNRDIAEAKYETVRIDAWFRGDTHYDLIFMDVEGYELDLVPAILARNGAAFILFEKHLSQYPDNIGPDYFISAARSHGFEAVEFDYLVLLRKKL